MEAGKRAGEGYEYYVRNVSMQMRPDLRLPCDHDIPFKNLETEFQRTECGGLQVRACSYSIWKFSHVGYSYKYTVCDGKGGYSHSSILEPLESTSLLFTDG